MADRRGLWLFMVLLLGVACAGPALYLWRRFHAQESFTYIEPAARPAFAQGKIAILKADGTRVPFKVEIARSLEEVAYGLMFRDTLPQGEGMIFRFDPPRAVWFWMKNTLIPLDMLFIRPDGTIASIKAQAVPQDITPIPSNEPVRAVVEIGGGQAEILSLRAGDKLVE